MGPTYNSLLLEQLFFPSLNFSLCCFFFPSLSFVPYFFSSSFFMCSLFFFSLFLLSLKKYFHFLILYQRTTEIYTNHDQLISLFFFITLFKFYKNVCKEMCTNYDLFFLLVDINLNHNVILYFFITLLILYW